MLVAVLSLLLHTDPPLVQTPDDTNRAPQAPAPTYVGPQVLPRYQPGSRTSPTPPAPLDPARFGLFFAPISLFSLTFWVEGELALGGGLDLFANVGGGPLGQFGFDVGFRYYVLGSSLDGFFLDVRGSAFSLPAVDLWMFGPGLMLGHGWRIKRFTLSIALGVTTWYAASRATSTSGVFFGSAVASAEVLIFPGVSQPPANRPAVQPTFRVSLGPWF